MPEGGIHRVRKAEYAATAIVAGTGVSPNPTGFAPGLGGGSCLQERAVTLLRALELG